MRSIVVGVWVVLSGVTLAASCGSGVNCENLCTRTLLCQVTFAPKDDLEGAKVASGERTAAESCALGCADQPAVTTESAQCVDDATDADQDPATCQGAVLACFGADIAQAQ